MHSEQLSRQHQVPTSLISPSSETLPKISVVVPCYNASQWISATLDSVLDQDWTDLEVIVVDDGSSDDSAQIVRENFPEVRLVQQDNKGVAAARNKGISLATGDWIAFVDADDIWLPNKLRMQWNSLQHSPEARMVYSAWHVWNCTDPLPDRELLDNLSAAKAGTNGYEGPSGWIYPELLADCHVWTSTVLIHRSLLEQIGSFNEGLRIGEDYDLWLRASRHTPILRVPLPLALYRMHPHSITKAAPSKNYQAFVIMKALESWGMRSPDGRTANKNEVATAIARTWRDFSAAHLAVRNHRQAVQGAIMALRYDWRPSRSWKLLVRTILAPLLGRGGDK